MKIYLDCYPCFLRQALEASRIAGANEPDQYRVLQQVLDKLQNFKSTLTAPEMAYQIHQIVRHEIKHPDPYLSAKQAGTRQSLALYPHLKQLVADATDPFETAVRISIAGNIIDFGMSSEFDLEGTLARVLAAPFAVNRLEEFRTATARAGHILFLADNAGETVFDRVLIETLNMPTTYVVKGGPIINDATEEDAIEAGIDGVAAIVSNGSNAPGTILSRCSKDFNRLFQEATLIIAKGQANYETLSDVDAPLFFLLQAKCPIIAQHLGVETRSVILA